MDLRSLYDRLLHAYGPQGWWPLLGVKGCNPTKTGSVRGYHPGDYSYPRSEAQQFEICVGAILTQNTAWTNVETALSRLADADLLTPSAILSCQTDKLREAIRPSGYFNAKTRKLRHFARFFLDLDGATPDRNQLLDVWGVGPETADSIRLYAYRVPNAVADAYTRRILAHLGFVDRRAGYEQVRSVCEESFPAELELCQEFHALMVEHAKRWYARRPYRDPLLSEAGRQRVTDVAPRHH